MPRVKICGLTNVRDYIASADAGADMAGFVFIPGTPRALTPAAAGEIILRARVKVDNVGLFRDAPVEDIIEASGECPLDYVQLHGAESPGYLREVREALGGYVKIMKVFKVGKSILPVSGMMPEDYDAADLFVFDTFHPELSGGSGQSYDFDIISASCDRIPRPFFIAGGLKPDNVYEVVSAVRPYGVDVSSGVETRTGHKSARKVKEFIKNAKKTDA